MMNREIARQWWHTPKHSRSLNEANIVYRTNSRIPRAIKILS